MKLISWNIWGMPLINPNSYTSPIKVIQQTIDNFDKTHELHLYIAIWVRSIIHIIKYNMLWIMILNFATHHRCGFIHFS